MDFEHIRKIYDGLVDARTRTDNSRDDVEAAQIMADEVEEALIMLLETLLEESEKHKVS
jgi:hypothetical protein